MPITARAVIDRASRILFDAAQVRWPAEELLAWLNDGRREIAVARPDVYARTEAVSLLPGTRQLALGLRFFDAIRNVSATGAPGAPVRVIEREMLDVLDPLWHTRPATGTIRHFAFDERSPRVYWVYPQAAAGMKLEISYSRSPEDMVIDAELAEEDIYAGALVDYVCYRAFLKDADYGGNLQRAMSAYGTFANVLGTGARATAVTTPNAFNRGGEPPRATA